MVAPISGASTIHLSIVVSGWRLSGWRLSGQLKANHSGANHSGALSQFEQIRFVHVERLAAAEERDDDRQPDGGLCRGHGHYDEDEQLASDVLVQPRKRDQCEVDRVKHELDAHKQRYDVALNEHADDAYGEQDGAKRQIPGKRNHVSIFAAPRPPVDGLGSGGYLLFVLFFLLLASERLLDALDVFLPLAAREQHRADDRHQDQNRRGLERD